MLGPSGTEVENARSVQGENISALHTRDARSVLTNRPLLNQGSRIPHDFN